MNSGKAAFLGLSLIAGALLINYVNADMTSGSSKYMLSSSEGDAYRMNTETGEISYCIGYKEKVECTKWAK